jgi:hypothetical protein
MQWLHQDLNLWPFGLLHSVSTNYATVCPLSLYIAFVICIWIIFLYVTVIRPPLWYSGHSSWLQIQRSRLDTRHCQISWEVAGLERGPLSLLSTIEELLERKSSSCGLENREYGCRDPSHWPCGILYLQKLALTWLTSIGPSVGIVRLWTQTTEFVRVFHVTVIMYGCISCVCKDCGLLRY